ncbi:MAG: phenylacetate--CoA ligase family protein [Clostridiaceae bacterium]|nr:phenylacetate--CoA ligase family protein [Clostridiaceae bacterium]
MLELIFKNSPKILKNYVKIFKGHFPYEKLLDKSFLQMYNFLQKSQWYSKEEHQEYQMTQIKKLLNYSYDNVPYYNELFRKMSAFPQDIKDYKDFKKIPYLTRDIVRQNPDQLLSKEFKKSELRYVSTAGTTNLPLRFYEQKRKTDSIEWAFIASIWGNVGYDINKKNRFVTLRGTLPHKGYYEYRGLELVLSSFYLIEENLMNYVKRIEDFNPDYIRAYPSSITILSEFILRNGIKLNLSNLKIVMCASENIYDYQREIIGAAFNTKVYSHYGHSERCTLGGECEKSTYYHMLSEYGYTELINNKDEDAVEEDELGEVVCTGFTNYAMPFIRYRTGDIGVNSNKECECGRKYKLIKRIEGRIHDFFVDKSGSIVPSTCADDGLRKIIEKVNNFQFIQNEPGKVILNVDFRSEPTEDEMGRVIKRFYVKYPRFELEIRKVDSIKRTKNGKQRFFVQNIPIDYKKQ